MDIKRSPSEIRVYAYLMSCEAFEMPPRHNTCRPDRTMTPGAQRERVGYPEAVGLVTRLYDQFGFDTADSSPLAESWRSGPGQAACMAHSHQTRSQLIANLAMARRPVID